jgi:hypothetical protein
MKLAVVACTGRVRRRKIEELEVQEEKVQLLFEDLATTSKSIEK